MRRLTAGLLATGLTLSVGCSQRNLHTSALPPALAFEKTPQPNAPVPTATETSTVLPVQALEAAPAGLTQLSLAELQQLTLERHPRLAQVTWAVETARGVAVQAGLYPNPTLTITGDELGDRQGPGGIWTLPLLEQEIVTGNKLGLSQAAALKEVGQAELRVISERFRVLTQVRQSYFELLALQKRVDILTELIGLAEESVGMAKKLRDAGVSSELDVLQLDVDLERYRAERDAATRAIPAVFRRLAAEVGQDDLPFARLVGDLERELPTYDLEQLKAYVLGIHPDLRAAQLGIERAQLQLQRANVEPLPNVTVGLGYMRQGQNKSNDWVASVSVPLPTWNKNQGNIYAAQSEIGVAVNEVGRVQNILVGQLAEAFELYATASKRAERYRTAILPKAQQSYELVQQANNAGQFDNLRLLQSQRALVEARLELVRSLGEAWQAASAMAGLMLDDQWPVPPTPQPAPEPAKD